MPSAISQWVSSSTAVNYRQWTSLSLGGLSGCIHTHTTSGWMTSVSTVQIPHQTVSIAQFSCHLSLKSCSSWKKLLQVYRTMYGGKVVLIIWWCLLPGPSCCSVCDEWCDVWSQWGMEHGPMHMLQLQGNAEWNMYYYYVISGGRNHLQHPTLLASLATSFITKLHHSMYNMFFFTSFIFEPWKSAWSTMIIKSAKMYHFTQQHILQQRLLLAIQHIYPLSSESLWRVDNVDCTE